MLGDSSGDNLSGSLHRDPAGRGADADAVLFNELVHEIEERGAFLAEMREIGGLDAAQERAVTQQIQSRVSRLGQLKQKLSASISQS